MPWHPHGVALPLLFQWPAVITSSSGLFMLPGRKPRQSSFKGWRECFRNFFLVKTEWLGRERKPEQKAGGERKRQRKRRRVERHETKEKEWKKGGGVMEKKKTASAPLRKSHLHFPRVKTSQPERRYEQSKLLPLCARHMRKQNEGLVPGNLDPIPVGLRPAPEVSGRKTYPPHTVPPGRS